MEQSFEREKNLELEELLSEIRQRVEQRRQNGQYPDGLEQDLDIQFGQLIKQKPPLFDFDPLAKSLEKLKQLSRIGYQSIVESAIPGGSSLHNMVSRLIERHFHITIDQINTHFDALYEVLDQILLVFQEKTSSQYNDIRADLNIVLQRLAAYERSPEASAGGVAELSRRIEQIEARLNADRFSPWYSQDHFEQAFRGTKEELLARYVDLANQFKNCSPVLDIGCGRGEFLELLKDLNVQARGIDLDSELLTQAKLQGLDVIQGDGLEELKSVPDNSLGGIVTIQVVEHLSKQQVLDLVSLSYDKLRVGGKIIIETVNPQSLYVYAHAFYLDPTHAQPIHPLYLSFLFTEMKFSSVDIQWRSPVEEKNKVQEIDGLGHDNVERINEILFAPQDYVVVAIK